MAASADNAAVQDMQEFKPNQEKVGARRKNDQRNRFSVLRMYERDRKKYMEEKKEARIRSYNEKVKRSREASARAVKKREAQYCQEAKRKYDKLRSLGWRNYHSEQTKLLDLDRKIWFDSRGQVHMRQLDNRGEKCWKQKYDRGLSRQEAEVQRVCSHR